MRSRALTLARRSPELRFDVPFGLDENIDKGAIVVVARVQIGRNASLVEGAALLDFLGEGFEKVIVLDAANDFVLVVKGEVTRDGAGKPASRFLGLNQGHFQMVADRRSAVKGCQMGHSVGLAAHLW